MLYKDYWKMKNTDEILQIIYGYGKRKGYNSSLQKP